VKYCSKFRPKFLQNFGSILEVQNFTKISTLSCIHYFYPTFHCHYSPLYNQFKSVFFSRSTSGRSRDHKRSRSRHDRSRSRDRKHHSRSRSPKRDRDHKKSSVPRKPYKYWDVPPTGFEHLTPAQYKAMQGTNFRWFIQLISLFECMESE